MSPERERLYRSLPELARGPETLGDQLCSVLEEAIIMRQLPPGEHLAADGLARRYGVSVIPVRESLRTLHANGWIDMRPHQGAYVRQASKTELNELFEARSVIETALAGFAAERRSAAQAQELERLVAQGFEAVDAADMERFSSVNQEFHDVIAACAGNQTLQGVESHLSKRVRFYFTTIAFARAQDSAREHDRLCRAIEAGDRDAAMSIARQHSDRTRALVEHVVS